MNIHIYIYMCMLTIIYSPFLHIRIVTLTMQIKNDILLLAV